MGVLAADLRKWIKQLEKFFCVAIYDWGKNINTVMFDLVCLLYLPIYSQ